MKPIKPLFLLAALLAPIALSELWYAFRPDDLSEQINEWFDTTRGRFEQFYAERHRNDHGAEG